MKTTRARIEFTRLPKDYAALCRLLAPRPIHDKAGFQNVTEITDAMAGHDLTPDQEDYFDLARLLRVHRTLGAMILRGERKLTLNHVRTLARHFGVSADALLS